MNQTAKRAIFVINDKGGVGKSSITRALLDIYRQNGLKVAAFDADGRVGQLMQYYGARGDDKRLLAEQNPLTHAGYFDVRDVEGRDTLVTALDTPGAEVILIDMPGGSLEEIKNVTGRVESVFREYRDAGWEVIVVVPIGIVKATVRTVLDVCDQFGELAHVVVVKNLGTGSNPTADDFEVFDGCIEDGVELFGNGRRKVEAIGGEVIVMPALGPKTYARIDFYDLPFTKAAEALSRGHRLRINEWLKDVTAELNRSRLAVKAVAASSGAPNAA
jgi:Mrp family chromosome partitioning ATPase